MHCRYYLYGIGSYDSRIPLCFYEQMRRRGGSRIRKGISTADRNNRFRSVSGTKALALVFPYPAMNYIELIAALNLTWFRALFF